MQNDILSRKFEIPYNFDINLLTGLKLLNIPDPCIYCIYMPPKKSDYTATLRSMEYVNNLEAMSDEDYARHTAYINKMYPNKLQLLLQQRKDEFILDKDKIKSYIDLGFHNFCCANIKQAQLIKEIDPTIEIVGSITMHISREDIIHDYKTYHDAFDAFVLDFSYNKNILKIKRMPAGFDYILLANALCNTHCDGDHHWWKLAPNDRLTCPGLVTDVGFKNSCIIRPMDLHYFDPYISVYKLQDRGWTTNDILRDIVLYTTNYQIYTGLVYDEDEYQQSLYFDEEQER